MYDPQADMSAGYDAAAGDDAAAAYGHAGAGVAPQGREEVVPIPYSDEFYMVGPSHTHHPLQCGAGSRGRTAAALGAQPGANPVRQAWRRSVGQRPLTSRPSPLASRSRSSL